MDAISKAGRDDLSLVTPPKSVVDDPEWRRSWARLQMYGERSVREAFDESGEADKQFVIAFIAWHHAAELNSKAARGDIPGHLAVQGAELVRLRKAVEIASDKANAEQEKLVAVVAKKVGRLPQYSAGRGEGRRSRRWINPSAA